MTTANALHLDGIVGVRFLDATPREPRKCASPTEERTPVLARQPRYAFPDRSSPAVESAEQLEDELLRAAIGDRAPVAVFHPHPCDVVKLGRSALGAACAAMAEQPERSQNREPGSPIGPVGGHHAH